MELSCLPSSSVWSQTCAGHTNAFIEWFSWLLCWQNQAGSSTEKTCSVSHISQLQSTRLVWLLRLRERKSATALSESHFPSASVCQVMPHTAWPKRCLSQAAMSLHTELVLLNSPTVQEDTAQFYTWPQKQRRQCHLASSSMWTFITRITNPSKLQQKYLYLY